MGTHEAGVLKVVFRNYELGASVARALMLQNDGLAESWRYLSVKYAMLYPAVNWTLWRWLGKCWELVHCRWPRRG